MIEFILNERKISTDANPAGTLLDFVRYDRNLVGTKIGCREGDCGACTVLIGEMHEGKLRYRSMTSCLTPLGNAQGKHVVTIEGLNMREQSPVQQAFTDCSATQCGFCTVGFVVSLTGYCMSDSTPNAEDAIGSMDGNICRCTGYKSIERAAVNVSEELSSASANRIQWLTENGFLPDYFNEISGRLKSIASPAIREQHAKFLVGGGTDLYVQKPEEVEDGSVDLVFDQKPFQGVRLENGVVVIGASATATDLLESEELQQLFPNLKKHLKLVSSTPIRNMGTVAGNLVNASPIGDLTAFLLALNARLVLLSKSGETRQIHLNQFYKGYKSIDLKAEEVVQSIEFDAPKSGDAFNFEKVSKRTYLDIASVNSAASINLADGAIAEVHVSVGGVGPTPIYLRQTREFLIGQPMNSNVIAEALKVVQTEISPISDVRGSEAYKRRLAHQLVAAHFIALFPSLVKMEDLV